MQARAVWLIGPRQVALRSEDLPAPGPGAIRVRARRSAISHGTELLVYRGEVAPDLPLDLPTFAGSFAFPIKYGYASVGVVEEVGPGVASVHPGALVFARHPHQDRYVIPAELAVPLPAGTDPEAAVFSANLETAVTVVLDAAVRFGETVVVFGQGVVGLLVTMLLARGGAGQVIAVDPAPARRERALRAGAAAALAPGADLATRIGALTEGRGADVAIEVSGNPAALQDALGCLAVQGTVVVASWYGVRPVPLDLGGAFHRRRLRIVSSQVGMLDPALAPRWDRQRRQRLVVSLLGDLPLADLISHRFPIEQADAAYRLIDRGPGDVSQVVFTYGEG